MVNEMQPEEMESYQNGIEDRYRNRPIETNPYSHTSVDYYLYCAGWNDKDINLMRRSPDLSK